jgi:acetyltransferase-like isoleucine patch superfamily enzyme
MNLKVYYRLHIRFKRFLDWIFSISISQNLSVCGTGFLVKSPALILGGKNIEVGNNFRSLENLRLECWLKYQGVKHNPAIKIGDNVSCGFNVHISCINKIEIMDNVMFGSNILVVDNYHGGSDSVDLAINPANRPLRSKGPIVIGKNTLVGDHVVILSNVTIGENVIIGAGSVVTKSIPDNSVSIGNPSRVIKTTRGSAS